MSEAPASASPPLCRACRTPVKPDARVCTTCGASQTLWGQITVVMKWIGAAATIVSLLIGMTSLYGLYDAQLDRQATVRELADAADLLRDEGDYRRAWQLYDDAATLDASSPRVRRGREQLARMWLPRASVSGDETFGALVDQLLPVLVRGHQQSSGKRAADFLALSGWAHYLERRDRPFSRVDIPATYQAALAIDASNVYAHMFLGHWLMSEERDIDNGTRHFEEAAATGEQTMLVRYYHASALKNLQHVSSTGTDQANAVYRGFLQLFDTMLANGEPIEETFNDRQRTVYETLTAYAKVPFEAAVPMLPVAGHQRLIEALTGEIENKSSHSLLSARVFLARLYEHTGDTASALAAFRALDAEVSRSAQVRKDIDAALQRLAGEKTDYALEREDPLAFHTASLASSALDSDRFKRALAWFDDLANDALRSTNTARLPAAIEATQAGLARIESHEGRATLRYRDAAMNLGDMQLAHRQLTDAIATYRTIPLPDNDYVRQSLHYNLACALSLQAATRSGPDGKQAELAKAAEQFELAVQAGYTDWDHIKRDGDLDALRDHPTYVRIMSGR